MSMRFWCSVCNKTINDGDVIFVCEGHAFEPVPDGHNRLRAMHKECAIKVGLAVKYPVYIRSDGNLEEE